MHIKELKPNKLKWKCPRRALKFKTTDEIEITGEIVGQERAVKAMQLGLDISSHGYNMFVTGVSGTGRETTVKHILDKIDLSTEELRDICYVRNFENPNTPLVLIFPAGGGRKFVDAVAECIQLLKSNIPTVLKSEKTNRSEMKLLAEYKTRKEKAMNAVKKESETAGFTIVNVPIAPGEFRPDVLPVREGEPVDFETLEKLVESGDMKEKEFDALVEKHDMLFTKLAKTFSKVRDIEIEAHAKLEKLHIRLLRPTVAGILSQLKEISGKDADVWADSILDLILDNLKEFAQISEDEGPYSLFIPNLIIDNAGKTKKPIIIEEFPDAATLFGSIDNVFIDGKPFVDHTMIKPGAIHRADGGYLIINAIDVVRQPALWEQLIQTLRNGVSIIRNRDPIRLHPVEINPEAIRTNVKLILLGSVRLYNLLASHEPEFSLLFRIRAAFDRSMESTVKNIKDFTGVIATIIKNENLLPLNAAAIAEIAGESIRISRYHDRLSTEFNRVGDYVRQACYFAKQDNANVVKAEHVKKAIAEKIFRLNLGQTYAERHIIENTIKVDTKGAVIGQVNGLAVYQGVDYAFGLPSRITARVSSGRRGIINVEREAELSGTSHTKGILIIAGFIRGKFIKGYPLSLSASIVFEQTYGGVDGDSASSTELYALLSAIAEVPIRQDLAITGSVNQLGEIQAIGGVNEKIEGFFSICNKRGLTGTQGVMIPISNVPDLQLRDNVIDAVRDGNFHIYPIKTIDEGIELLTGLEAGKRMKNNSYPDDTIYGKVDRRLEQMAEVLCSYGYRD